MHISFDKKMAILLDLLDSAGLCKPGEVKGATELEIDSLEREVGLRLPAAYKSYLRAMGKGAGDLFVGTDVFLLQVPGITEYAAEVLHELDPSLQLPADTLVFSSHQGYVFYYFRTDPPDDDPPVYCFTDDTPPALSHPSFTTFLQEKVRHRIAVEEMGELRSLHWINQYFDAAQAYAYGEQYVACCQENGIPVSEDIVQWLEEYKKPDKSADQ
jgi:hypothetical protein